MAPNRRDVLRSLIGAPLAAVAGCSSSRLPPAGEIIGAADRHGHRLRDAAPQPTDVPADAWQTTDVLIVGGGVAGLAAARELRRQGVRDFVLLELEHDVGGTSRAGTLGGFACPWGAHYLPVPLAHQADLIALLDEVGVLEGRRDDGGPIVAEQFLCREPEERIFYRGTWHEGLYLLEGASDEDLRQWRAFHDEIARWAGWRDGSGRRAFTIPIAECSTDPVVTELDQLTMAAWLRERGFTSTRLWWSVDYGCRDDYGLTVEQTSAWAGLFYFAARIEKPGDAAQPLITWSEGNCRLVQHLHASVTDAVHSGWLVTHVAPGRTPDDAIEVVALSVRDNAVRGWRAQRVVWAAPQFVAPHVIAGLADDPARRAAARAFRYGSWMVANLLLGDRPRSQGFPLAWDNVLYESPSLGYVVATHQLGRDYGPTVLTYYYPLCDDDPRAARQRLLDWSWSDCAELALSDLGSAHPEIRRLTTRLDVVRWGHAMIRPEPGFLWGESRQVAAQPWRGVHFANTDLSGVALFEEAFHHGVRAARETAAELRRKPVG
jgi:hypothetical protein